MKHKFICLIAFIFCLQNTYSQIIDSTYLVEISKSKKIINKFKRLNKIPGLSVTISHKNKIVWSEGFGFSDLKKKTKVYPDSTLFRVASISKSITATGLAVMVEKNEIKLDESIYSYISDFPKKKYDITIRQLAGHTSGIRHYKDKEFIINEFMQIDEGIKIFKDDTLLFRPNSQYKYSSYGWNLISLAMERSKGIAFEDIIIEYVFKPLKMKNTIAENKRNKTNKTTTFYHKTKQNKVVTSIGVNNYYKLASGGFLSTSEDLVLLGESYLSNKLINNQNINTEFTSSQKLESGKLTNYGIGWSCGYDKNNKFRFMHNGSGVGAYGFIIVYPKEELVFALLTNIDKLKLNEEVDLILNLFLE